MAHNDIFRSLMNVRRGESVSTLFVQHHVNNLDIVLRKCYYSLMTRVVNSNNLIITALVNSQVRVYSNLWHRWGLALGQDLVEVV